MLYTGCGETETCPECLRKWVDLGGQREPVLLDEYDEEDEIEEAGPCLECGGDW